MGRASGVGCPPFILFLGLFLLLLFTKPGRQNAFTLVYVHQWTWPRGLNMGSTLYRVWVPCNNINTELFLSKKNYFSVHVCINFMPTFLWHFCFGCGMDVCFLEEKRKEVWIFRNETLLQDHSLHNQQNWDFHFHLTAIIVPEFIFSIKFPTGFIYLFFSFFCLCACAHTCACTHVLFVVLVCLCAHTHTLLQVRYD